MVDAILYRISDADGNQYIGYTTRTLDKRYTEHMDDPDEPETMKQWLAATPTKIELFRTIRCVNLAEVKSFEAAHIVLVPHANSKNTQGKRKVDMDWEEKCALAAPAAATKQQHKPPKITDDVKRKAYKVQRWMDGKNVTKYFSYRAVEKEEAMAGALAYVNMKSIK